jgi:hypothetical protein
MIRILTLTQPWATLMALGLKTIETRSWGTAYRGDVAIHAAKGWDKTAEAFANKLHFDGVIEDDLPFGQVLCVVNLLDTHLTEYRMVWPSEWRTQSIVEQLYGDYSAGRWAWTTDNLRVLTEPLPWKGAQGLRRFDESLLLGRLPGGIITP